MRASIAVIIPCRDMAHFIGRAIGSVLAQQVPELELIVVDDGSTDGSRDVIASFGQAVTLLVNPEPGANNARNFGLHAAKADFVLFIDADDYLLGSYLPQLAAHLTPETDLAIGAYVRALDGVFGPVETYQDHGAKNLISQFLTNSRQAAVFLWRRAFVIAQGGWAPGLPISQDFDFGMRMMLAGPRTIYPVLHDAHAVYWQYDSPHRITGTLNSLKAETWLAVLQRFKPELLGLDDGAIRAALAARYFVVAANLFAAGYISLGRRAAMEYRALGLQTPPDNSWAGQLLIYLLGLELKTRVTWQFYKITGRPKPYPYNLRAAQPAAPPSNTSYFVKARSL